MLDRNLISDKFWYKSNDFNFRLSFPEENTVKKQMLFTRIDYWRNVFIRHLTLKPNQNIMLYLNQTSLDTFAIYLAALECDLNLVEDNADFLLHTLADSELINLELSNKKHYNYFDLADLRFDGVCNYKQNGTSIVYGTALKDIVIEKNKLKGSLLHTKYLKSNLFVDFMLPTLASDKIEFHSCLGYTNIEEGMTKISTVIQKTGIKNILLPSLETVDVLCDICAKKDIDISKLNIISYDTKLCYSKADQRQPQDTVLQTLPTKYGLDGKILEDEDTFYFQFNNPIDNNIAQVKIKSMNSFIKSKYNKTITKWAVPNNNDKDEAMIIFRNLQW